MVIVVAEVVAVAAAEAVADGSGVITMSLVVTDIIMIYTGTVSIHSVGLPRRLEPEHQLCGRL